MKLSPNFTLDELIVTKTGLPNYPESDAVLDRLRSTALKMEEVRLLLGGKPIKVNSGYRSPEVNHKVRGSKTSAHCLGYAVDFVCPAFGTPLEIADKLAASNIKFDQLILEYGWVHISFNRRFRMMLLTKRSKDAPYEHGINA